MTRRFAVCLSLVCFASIAIAQVATPPVQVPEETMEKLLIHKVKPVEQLEPGARIRGSVVLKAVIDKTGDLENLQMVSGHPMLVPAAIEAAKQRRYRPYLLNGIAVDVATTIQVEFADRNPSEAEALTAMPEPPEQSGTPVHVRQEEMQGHVLRKVPPIYPPRARAALIQGTVLLEVTIDKLGNVDNVQLISGHPILAPAAIEAVKQWKYAPYELNGEAVEVESQVQVNFKLENDPPKGTVGDLPGTLPEVVSGVVGNIPKPLEGERVAEAVMRLRRLQRVDPVYPWNGIQAQIQGIVVLDVRIDSSGSVAEIVRMSGPPVLAAAATDAVKQWKYDPYVKEAARVAVVSTVRLDFALTKDQSNGTVSEPAPGEDAKPPQIQLPQRIRVSSRVSEGLLARKLAPEYPPDARDGDIQGTVVLHVIIDKEGNVSTVELISGDPMLAAAAIDAVRQWKYRPYLLNGQAIEADTTIRVNFALSIKPQ